MSRDSGVRVRRARQARRAERAGRRASSSLEDARRPALSRRRTPTDAPAGFVAAPQAPPASHPVGSRVPRDRGRASLPLLRRNCGFGRDALLRVRNSGGTRSCASAIREGHAPSWPYASWFCNCLIKEQRDQKGHKGWLFCRRRRRFCVRFRLSSPPRHFTMSLQFARFESRRGDNRQSDAVVCERRVPINLNLLNP